MRNIIKSITAFLLCICLFLSVGCTDKLKNSTGINPEEEAAVENGAIRPLLPEMITDEDVDAKKLGEAVISDSELTLLWSYSYLDETEKRIYRIMLNMIRNVYSGWVDIGYIGRDSSGKIARAYRAVTNDFPEYYWIPNSYYITSKNSNVALSFQKHELEDGYGYTKDQIIQREEELTYEIMRVINKTKNAKTDFEKELIIHDAMCEMIVYGESSSVGSENDAYSVYGALVNRHAVCEGYARTFKLLCKYAGIECILITGDSKGVGHMWNMVKLDNQWYHVDVTWDDLRDKPLHTYLNVTELQIRADHDIDITYEKAPSDLASQGNSFNFHVPPASSLTYNYFYKTGRIIDTDPITPAVDELIKQYNEGETYAELFFANSNSQKDFKNNYETYVVEIQKKCNEKLGKMYFKLQTISFPSNSCVFYFELQ